MVGEYASKEEQSRIPQGKGLSSSELEKLAELNFPESLEKLRQAFDAHEKQLAEMRQQHKTGQNALVKAQKTRITFIQERLARVERLWNERDSS